jgi:hypothetical protein
MAGMWMAAASVIGGLMSSSSQSDAASQASQSATQAAQLQLAQYEQTMGYEAPGRNLGYGSMNLLAKLYGIPQVYNGPGSVMAIDPKTGQPFVQSTGGPSGPQGAPAYYGYGPNASASPGSPASSGGTPYGTPAYPGAIKSGYGNNLVTGYGVYSDGHGGTTQSPTGGAPMGPGRGGSGLPVSAPAAAVTPTSGGAPDYSGFYNSPNYKFALQQGNLAVQRQAAAGGNLYGANTMTQEDQFSQGLASQQYNTYVGQLNSMAGLGQNAVAAGASAGTAAASGASNSLITAGMANASGQIGSAGALTSGINTLARAGAGAYQNYSQNNVVSNGGYGDPGANANIVSAPY